MSWGRRFEIAICVLLSALCIIGGLLNAYGKRVGFIVWVIADAGWIIYCVYISLYAQIPMWVFYGCIGTLGWVQWGRRGIGE